MFSRACSPSPPFFFLWKFGLSRAVAHKAATFFFFCKSICLNTFRLKGENVSAFQGGRPPWVRLAAYAQSVAVSVRACTHLCVCPPTCQGVPTRPWVPGQGWARGGQVPVRPGPAQACRSSLA